MFGKGEMIMCGGHGVCCVVDITGNPIDRMDTKKKYYMLEPVFEKASTVYTPVDNEKVVMRKIMTKDEAEVLIGQIPEIETVWIQEEKRREQTYKEAIRTYDSRSLVQIIKTLYQRKSSRISEGKKVLSSDEQYLHKAEELLYSASFFVRLLIHLKIFYKALFYYPGRVISRGLKKNPWIEKRKGEEAVL